MTAAGRAAAGGTGPTLPGLCFKESPRGPVGFLGEEVPTDPRLGVVGGRRLRPVAAYSSTDAAIPRTR